MTHLDTKYVFQKNKCVMIYGKNSTDNGSDSNGSGKSTIIEAITLAIAGITSRDVNKDEFINDDARETYVQFDLENSIGLIKELSIRRTFDRKKSSKVEIWENGVHNEEITSVNEANSRIYELIGLTREDILHFFIIGQDSNYSFLTAGDTEKKDIISRFSNISFINDKIDELKSNNKDLSDDLDEFDVDIQKLENKNEFLQEQKEDIEENFESEKKSKISNLKKKQKKNKSKISKLKAEKEAKKKEIKELNDELDGIKVEDTGKIEKSLKSIKKDIRTEKDQRDALKSTNKHYDLILKGKISCPDCDHEFNPDNEIPLSDIPKLKSDNDKKISKLDKSIEKNTFKQSKLNDKLDKIDDQEIEIRSLNKKIARLDVNLSSKDEEISDLEEAQESLKKKISKAKKEDSTDKLSDIETEISTNKEMLEVLNSGREEIEEKIQSNDYWIYHFGKKGFMTFLTNKSVKSIEGITNSFLKRMHSDLQVNIEGFTKLKNGDVREKINVDIVTKGMTVGSYKRYSGGEKGRINLANILGLQKLINLTCESGGLNLLILDEVFEGLDRSGQKDVLNIMEDLKVTSLVITHRSESIGAENELYIEKIDGISRIIS